MEKYLIWRLFEIQDRMSQECHICHDHDKNQFFHSVEKRTSTTSVKLKFKIFSLLEIESENEETICQKCYSLIDQIDVFQVKLRELQSQLKSRHQATEEDELIGDVEEENANYSVFEEDNAVSSDQIEPKRNFWSDINNPIYLQAYLDSGKMETADLTSSQRGEQQLIYKDFIYSKKSYQPTMCSENQGIFKWRCVNHNKANKCKAQAATSLDGLLLKDSVIIGHNHEPDFRKKNGILLKERLRTLAQEHPEMKTVDIIASCNMLLNNEGNEGLKDDKSLHRFIQRQRSRAKKRSSLEME